MIFGGDESFFVYPTDVFQDPQFEPLALNSPGKTKTHALKGTSPAINAGIAANDIFGNPITTDQRGVARSDGSLDIGAYEYIAPTFTYVPRR